MLSLLSTSVDATSTALMVMAPAVRLDSPALIVTVSASSIPRLPEVGLKVTPEIVGRFASMAGVLVAPGEVEKVLLKFPALSTSTMLIGIVADWAISVSPDTTPYFTRYEPPPKSVSVLKTERVFTVMADPESPASPAVILTVRESAIFSVPVVGLNTAAKTPGALASMPGVLEAFGEVVKTLLEFPAASCSWTLMGIVSALETSSSPSVMA